MLVSYVAIACLLLLTGHCDAKNSKTSYQWIEDFSPPILVDHFSHTKTDRFRIKVLYNLDLMQPGGPLLFYPGNEASIEVFAKNTGIMWDIAPLLGAGVLFVEYRYWGESLPYGNNSFSGVNTMAAMTSLQAITDFSEVLPWFLRTHNLAPDTPVIAIGGSFGGMLGVWMKLKYPNQLLGVWAASAPMVWFRGGNRRLGGFGATVQKAFQFNGCDRHDMEAIYQAFHLFDYVMQYSMYWKELEDVFKVDPQTPLTSYEAVQALREWVETSLGYMAMANYPYPTHLLAKLPAWPVKKACEVVHRHRRGIRWTSLYDYFDAMSMLREMAEVYYGKGPICLDAVVCGTPEGPGLADVWNYQKCTEVIIELCNQGPPNDFFPNSCKNRKDFLRLRKEFCAQRYSHLGWTPDLMREDAIRDTYGLDFSNTENIIFTDGSIDPWGAGGVGDDTPGIKGGEERGIYKLWLEGSAHHLDLRQPNTCDPVNVVNARFQIIEIIKCWLNPKGPGCPYQLKPLPPFSMPNKECKDRIYEYPWGQTA